MVQFYKEASQTRDSRVAAFLVKSIATLRAARPDPSLRKRRLFRMTIKLHLLEAGAKDATVSIC
jgi:hypothetical protein